MKRESSFMEITDASFIPANGKHWPAKTERASSVSPGSQAHLAVRQHRGEKPLQWAYLGKGRALFSGAAASKLPLVGVKT